ncbi:MAG: MAPEG family protein [Proteobacteria bacterium]|nr:MAPEG family protein [Pseudomonadota bacterium]
MEAVVIVTALALIQFVVFGIQVSRIRGKSGIKAPTMTGSPELDRMFRVHVNTMEQLVLFIPALWLYAYYVNPLWAAGIGLVYVIGRFIYRAAYLKDPSNRALGFALSFLPSAVMLVWVMVDAAKSYF